MHFPTNKLIDNMTESWSAFSICICALLAYTELLQLESHAQCHCCCRHAV